MATRHVALQYMTGFRCIGPACEDHCCGGWTVLIDQEHHDKLRALMTERGQAERFTLAMAPPPDPPTPTLFAMLKQGDDGNCTLLTADRSCEVHSQYGEDALADVCAIFPRRVSMAGERMEICGSVSCPELARLALLVEDACEIVPCEPAVQGRGVVTQTVTPDPVQPYAAALDLIRGTMFGLLTRHEYPMRSRLFFLAMFGERLGAFLVKGTESADRNRLLAEIRTIEAPQTLAGLDQAFREAEGSTEVGMAVAIKLLSARLERRVSVKLRQIFGDVMKGFAAAGAGVTLDGDDVDSATVSPGGVAAHHDAQRDRLEALVGERLDLYLENFGRNWVMYDWYVFAPSVALHVQRFLVKVAVIRLLLLHHPRLPAAAADGPDAVDRLAVEVIYSLSRSLEHSEGAVNTIIASMVGDEPPLAVALALLKI